VKLLFILMFMIFGCGESPLFNHKNEKKNSLAGIFTLKEVPTFSNLNYQFKIEWHEAPKLGANKFDLKIWDMSRGTDQGPFHDPPAELNIFLWMPAMGHGSSPVKISKNDAGDYHVSDVNFIMGGAWQIKFQLIQNSKVIDEVDLTYHL
jgi:hypothetical protein